ncbi:hypothetical protein COOONC_00856 [Cooperia oncophora]
MNHFREHYLLVNYTTAHIFIQKASAFPLLSNTLKIECVHSQPGNLNEPGRLAVVDRLVQTFESYPECLGANFSHYFVRDYKLFREAVELEEERAFGITADKTDIFSEKAMQPFFSWPEFKHWNGFVKFDEHGK